MTDKILLLCENCVSGYHCANNGCEREDGTWMGVDISDPRLRPERGRLLVIENGQEVEIKKVEKELCDRVTDEASYRWGAGEWSIERYREVEIW